MSTFHKRLEFLLKHNRIIQYLYRRCFSFLLRFVGNFICQDERLILFSSFAGKKYNDSPRVLFESMREDIRYAGYRFVWAFDNPENFDIKGSEKVKIDTWNYFKTALKAHIWITSVNIERGLSFKPKHTLYINTWHGAGTKKIGNACAGRKDYDLSSVDMMLVQSDFEKEIFLHDFQCREDAIRKIGFPRNDELFHITLEQKVKLRCQFGIPDGKRVILYAPTWRDSRDGGLSYVVEPPLTMDIWKRLLSERYVMLFRMHTFTTKFDMQYDDFARNVSDYDNLNHILAITDILITDYSTIVYDSAVARIPFICFGFDFERYNNERGFYYDLNAVYPGGVLHSEDEVLSRIAQIETSSDMEEYESFRKKYIEAGGNATKTILYDLLEIQKK